MPILVGFIASAGVKPQVIGNTWQNSFTNDADERIYDSPIATEVAAYRNQFLSGKAADYNIIKTSNRLAAVAVTTFGLGSTSGASEATYKSIPLGGDNAGGIGYLRGVQSGDNDFLYYAFLNDDSKIGVQIGQTTGTAYYNGQFRARALSNTNVDFRLTVNFGEETIAAFVQEAGGTDNYFHLTGSYDSVGVITGKVQYGKFTYKDVAITDDVEYDIFTAENPLVWVDDTNRRSGFLSGIISKDNVLGVFCLWFCLWKSGGQVTGGRGNIGFVGGFVARRFDFF